MLTFENAGYETSAYQTTPEPLSAQVAERAAMLVSDLLLVYHQWSRKWAPLENRALFGLSSRQVRPMTTRALKIPMGKPVEAGRIIAKNQTIVDIGCALWKNISLLPYRNLSEATALTTFAYVAKGAEQARSKFHMIMVFLKVGFHSCLQHWPIL